MKENADVCVHVDERWWFFVEIEARSRLKLASTDEIGSINIVIGRLTVPKILLTHFKNMC